MGIILTEAINDEIEMPIPRDNHIPNSYYRNRYYERSLNSEKFYEETDNDYTK